MDKKEALNNSIIKPEPWPWPCDPYPDPYPFPSFSLSSGEIHGMIVRKLIKFREQTQGNRTQYRSVLLNELKNRRLLSAYDVTLLEKIYSVLNDKRTSSKEETMDLFHTVNKIHEELIDQNVGTSPLAIQISSIVLNSILSESQNSSVIYAEKDDKKDDKKSVASEDADGALDGAIAGAIVGEKTKTIWGAIFGAIGGAVIGAGVKSVAAWMD
ncbi:hypothetical protein KHA94_08035 [Bacillus sp. FJAT-49705]|uniref:Glycine zipper domain-containing protein n=1 Tax=Cytobacillus citreus TaxID=2833586 RepID=A0ABS5NQR5_9BACI|nr:hypothetical protein [Cytobacillus citreus]MBS4190153.1 hypothetical protein [Cytobacillus citreus]